MLNWIQWNKVTGFQLHLNLSDLSDQHGSDVTTVNYNTLNFSNQTTHP